MRHALQNKRLEVFFDRSALILIDMQIYQTREGAITKNYQMISPKIPEYYLKRVTDVIEPNIIRLLERFRSANSTVIFTKYASNREDESDLPAFIREYNRFARDEFGEAIIPHINDASCELIESLEPLDSEMVIQKSCSGAFTNTNLDSLLKERNIEQIFVAGVLTHACVESTARVGCDLGYEVIVINDACASLDPKLHENALAAMEVISIRIASTKEIMNS